MNRSCKELKRIARENLNEHYSIPMGALLLAGLIPMAAELPFSMLQKDGQPIAVTIMFYAADLLILLLSAILSAGIARLHLSMARKQQYNINTVFYGFQNHPDRYLAASILALLAELAGALPMIAGAVLLYASDNHSIAVILCIPLAMISLILVIMIQLWYALVLYLLLDHSEMSAAEAFKLSHSLMRGHKGQLFYLYLSFIGMMLVGILSLGIGMLWVLPYQSQTTALFYLDVIGELPSPRG